MMTIKKEVFST